jgi:heme exporter protein B
LSTSFAFLQRIVKRETLLLLRQLRLIVNFSLFYLMILVFIPLTLPPDPQLLRTIAPGLIWIAVLFATLLSAERLFQQDFEDGILEQWLVSGHSVGVLVGVKILVHWCVNIIPILLFTPLIAVLFGFNANETAIVLLSLMVGSPAIFFLCGLAAVFSTSLKQKNVLIALILLPLTIPVMIFGSGAITATLLGLPVAGYLALLLGFSLIAAALLPIASAGVMRITLID